MLAGLVQQMIDIRKSVVIPIGVRYIGPRLGSRKFQEEIDAFMMLRLSSQFQNLS